MEKEQQNKETSEMTVAKIIITCLIGVAFIISSYFNLKAVYDSSKDVKDIRDTMKSNNTNATTEDKKPGTAFTEWQIKNAELLKEAYITRLDFVKEFSLMILKFAVAFSMVWLNISF